MSDKETKMALLSFAITRSCNAATAANENSRPMAQAALLINGGAATAVIAFLTKDKVDPIMLTVIPWSLCFYGLGVVAGAIAMYFMTESLDYFNTMWENIARSEPQEAVDEQHTLGDRYWRYVRNMYAVSIGSFVFGSVTFACGIWRLALPATGAG